ncbi:hypothetical protein Tco_0756501 [Tanacetum coccineum]
MKEKVLLDSIGASCFYHEEEGFQTLTTNILPPMLSFAKSNANGKEGKSASKVPMLKPSEFEIWRMRIEQYIQIIDYALWEVIENGATLPKTTIVEGVMTKMPITTVEEKAQRRLEVKARKVKGLSSSSSSTIVMGPHPFVSSSNNNTSITNEAVNTTHGVSTASTQVNAANSTNIDNLSDAVICAFFASQPNSPQLVHEDLQQIHPDDMEEMDLRWKMAMLTMRDRSVLKNTGRKLTINGNKTIGFDNSKVSQQLPKRDHMLVLVDMTGVIKQRKGLINVTHGFSYSSPDSKGLESVEEKLEVYKENKSIYLQDIKGLKFEIHIGEITIRELRKKLEIVQKEKDGIQLNVDKFEHASKSLNKLIECQIVDNCKKGLGYENYNAVLPPYTGNFMPPTPDLSFTGLDEFVNKPIVENSKAMSSKEEPKVVTKNDDAPIIEE